MLGTGRWRLWPLVGLVLVAGAAGSVLLAVAVTRDRSQISDVVQAVTSVLVPTGGLMLWLWTRSRRRPPTSTAVLASAADALAAAVEEQWERAAAERRLRHPAPIRVRWRWSLRGVTGPVHEALGSGSDARFPPLPGMRAATSTTVSEGGFRDLVAVYGGLDSGRVIILGGPGTGKSAAAILTVLDALSHRRGLSEAKRARVPVPVLLTAHGWDPRYQRLDEWLTTQLSAEYPFLRSAGYGRDAAGRLISGGRIALILDGFDEIADEIRPAAIHALDQQVTFRLLLLTRTRELTDAVTGGHLHGAAALELLPVPAQEAADYLIRCQVQPTPPAWRCLADHLQAVPDSTVGAALDNPLMLTLVRDTFPDPGEVDDLLKPGRFTGPGEVEEYLLDRVLPVAYRPRLGSPPPPYSLEQARSWLGFLATEMNRRDTRDLAWWQIRRWTPASFRFVIMAVPSALGLGSTVGVLFGVVFGLATAVVAGVLAGLANGLTIGLVVGLRGGSGTSGGIEGRRRRWTTVLPWGTDTPGLTAGLVSGLVCGILTGIVVGSARGVVAGTVIGLAAALGLGFADGITENLLEARRSTGPRRLRPFRWRLIASRANLTVGMAFGLVFALPLGMMVGLANGPVAGVVAGVMIGLVAALLFGIINGLVQGSADASAVDPVTCWHRDRQSGLAEGAAYGLAGAFASGLAGGIVGGTEAGIAAALTLGVGVGVAFTVSVSEAWLATIGFLLLGGAGLFPRHGIHFLEDARARDVLRTVGSVYQFRHARLQDQLAATHPRHPTAR